MKKTFITIVLMILGSGVVGQNPDTTTVILRGTELHINSKKQFVEVVEVNTIEPKMDVVFIPDQDFLTLERLLVIDMDCLDVDDLCRRTLTEILNERQRAVLRGTSTEEIDLKISKYLDETKIKE